MKKRSKPFKIIVGIIAVALIVGLIAYFIPIIKEITKIDVFLIIILIIKKYNTKNNNCISKQILLLIMRKYT